MSKIWGFVCISNSYCERSEVKILSLCLLTGASLKLTDS